MSLLALNDATLFGRLTVAFGEHRTYAAEARRPHAARMTISVIGGQVFCECTIASRCSRVRSSA